MRVYARAFPRIFYADLRLETRKRTRYQYLINRREKKLRDAFPARFSSVLMTFTGSHHDRRYIAAQENNDII